MVRCRSTLVRGCSTSTDMLPRKLGGSLLLLRRRRGLRVLRRLLPLRRGMLLNACPTRLCRSLFLPGQEHGQAVQGSENDRCDCAFCGVNESGSDIQDLVNHRTWPGSEWSSVQRMLFLACHSRLSALSSLSSSISGSCCTWGQLRESATARTYHADISRLERQHWIRDVVALLALRPLALYERFSPVHAFPRVGLSYKERGATWGCNSMLLSAYCHALRRNSCYDVMVRSRSSHLCRRDGSVTCDRLPFREHALGTRALSSQSAAAAARRVSAPQLLCCRRR